jgi:hypothetical protein
MNIRRCTAALAVSAALCATAAPAAFAESPSPKTSATLPSGLYGTQDPTYDGVWRQSIALLAQDTVRVTPAKKAVDWLAGQQCASGGFAAYRADATEPCDAKTAVDSNSTAAAVQALAALGGHADGVRKAVAWLRSVQNQDGGWGYGPGGPSDANSTSVVIGALVAAGEKPGAATSQKGKSAYDALAGLQLGCDAQAAERGAFAYQPDAKGRLTANADATAAGALAGLGRGFVVQPPGGKDTAAMPMACGATDSAQGHGPDRVAGAAAGYLAALLEKNGGHLSAPAPGADKPVPDYANTADAVIALAAGGHRTAAGGPLRWLEQNSATWAKDNPAALGTLVLAARAAGTDPRDFGGRDLVRQLNATGPVPEATGPAEQSSGRPEQASGGDGTAVWWIVGAGLAAVAGVGFLLSGRRKKP